MKNRDDVKNNDHEALHFLLWHDCIERLDTLLLEARHVQVNIIYALQVPALYSYLEWEENKLWPEKKERKWEEWDDYIAHREKLDDLVKRIVLLYPTQKNDAQESEELNRLEKHSKLYDFKKKMRVAVKNAKKNRDWNTDQRHLYLSLRKLQILKQNVFRDKLIFCQYGLDTFINAANRHTSIRDKKIVQSKLLLLRSAILEKIRDYIGRIGDHQAHFSKTHDFGLQDHPRPAMAERVNLIWTAIK